MYKIVIALLVGIAFSFGVWVWGAFRDDFELTEDNWEDLVGMNVDTACELLKELKPDFRVIPVHKDSSVTADYRLDRIRVYHDDDRLVSKTPIVG